MRLPIINCHWHLPPFLLLVATPFIFFSSFHLSLFLFFLLLSATLVSLISDHVTWWNSLSYILSLFCCPCRTRWLNDWVKQTFPLLLHVNYDGVYWPKKQYVLHLYQKAGNNYQSLSKEVSVNVSVYGHAYRYGCAWTYLLCIYDCA